MSGYCGNRIPAAHYRSSRCTARQDRYAPPSAGSVLTRYARDQNQHFRLWYETNRHNIRAARQRITLQHHERVIVPTTLLDRQTPRLYLRWAAGFRTEVPVVYCSRFSCSQVPYPAAHSHLTINVITLATYRHNVAPATPPQRRYTQAPPDAPPGIGSRRPAPRREC